LDSARQCRRERSMTRRTHMGRFFPHTSGYPPNHTRLYDVHTHVYRGLLQSICFFQALSGSDRDCFQTFPQKYKLSFFGRYTQVLRWVPKVSQPSSSSWTRATSCLFYFLLNPPFSPTFVHVYLYFFYRASSRQMGEFARRDLKPSPLRRNIFFIKT
jgi:hypothetical protein